MKQTKDHAHKVIYRNIRILENLEQKYGFGWVKRTYENAPLQGSKFFDLAIKMNAVYHYRKNGKTGDTGELLKILDEKKDIQQTLEKDSNHSFYKSSNISPQLQATLSGFNGSRGKKMKSPEEFYDRWLAWKRTKIKKANVKKIIDEAVLKKDEVIRVIGFFFSNQLPKNIRIPTAVSKTYVYPKKQKLNEKRIDFSTITLIDEQKDLFELLQASQKSIFITGKAGTGKSLLLQYFRQNTKKNTVVCAPTGVAALNVGGQTIHSLFKLPPRFIPKNSLKLEKRTAKIIKHIDTVVIDEISMVRPDLIDGIDHLLRQAKKSDTPFGGVQIIMFGDLYQLPPVQSDSSLENYFQQIYGGGYFFNADVWKNISFEIRTLANIFRQKDEDFKIILNAIREGTITEAQLETLNKRADVPIPAEGVITLATINNSVTSINDTRLTLLEGKTYEFKADISGVFDKTSFPTDEILRLKKGAQVMLVKNDKEKRWVNGTLGYIHSITDTEILVNIDGAIHSVPKEKWEKISYNYNEGTNALEEQVVSSFTQFPLRLAWAITIHKSQGQTYTSVAIDMGRGAFAHGQTYVAFSRCKTLEGLYLKRKITRKDIIVDPKIIDFMKNKIS